MQSSGPIIIVDDDVDDHFLYENTLKRLKISNDVLFFRDGQEAYDYLKQPVADPFLILSDINMPLMDGLKFRTLLCQDKVLCKKKIPFVFISTAADEKEMEKAYALQVHGFFKKEAAFDRHENILKVIIEYWKNCRCPNN